jgi:hypothetical protein
MDVLARPSIVGHITLVQEQRFRLLTEAGQSFLLTLAHDAPLDADCLCDFLAARTRVVVEYQGEPGLVSGVAHSVRPVHDAAHSQRGRSGQASQREDAADG